MTGKAFGYLFALGLVGCSSSSESTPVGPAATAYDGTPLVANFSPPSPPANALQLVSPVIHGVAPGDSVEYCYYTKHIVDSEITIKAGQGFQASGGHHVVIYWTATPAKEDLHICTEADMTNLHVLSGGGAEAGNGVINDLPAGGAFHVPVGAQFVMNVHALNVTDKPIDTQAVANLYYGDPSLKPLTSFYVTGTSLHVEPHASGSYSASCTALKDFQAVRLLGHMHEWGSRMQIALDDGTGPKTIYDKPGSGDFSYNPPYIDYPTDTPLTIKQGTVITATCDYNNTTAKPLDFPTEMCAAFGYLLGTESEFGCSDNAWNHQ